MARRLRRQQAQRERLLRHAVEAGDAERRRSAGDLHDGPVQDLAGVALSLAAALRRPAGQPLDEAAVAITADDSPVLVGIIGGAAIGVTAVLIGDAIRSERERTREAQEFARRTAELRDRDVEHAVAEERLRIARDVHDITGHHLSAISLQAAGAGRTTSDPVAREALERIHRLTSEALGQTRRALGFLRASGPAAHAPTPRLEQLEQLLEPAREAGLAVDLRVDGASRPLSDEVEICAYRVVQESLTNVVRHARATRVRVRVRRTDDELEVQVDDDGQGFGPGEVAARGGQGHLGLRALEGLFGDAGGALTVRSARGRGTLVEMRVPLR
jgi:signal transduction histidine kinase